MSKAASELMADVERLLGTRLTSAAIAGGTVTVECEPGDWLAVARALRDDSELDFAQLSDLAGVDYQTYGVADWQTNRASAVGFSRAVTAGEEQVREAERPRFAVVVHLLSLSRNQRLRLRSYPPGEPPTIASLCEVWPAANWFEREAFDLFGILFEGHADLRRLLTDYGFIGHPFRKDFPLEGNVEVRYDPAKGRVVYQPVTIENRVLVPRVLREEVEDSLQAAAGGEDA